MHHQRISTGEPVVWACSFTVVKGAVDVPDFVLPHRVILSLMLQQMIFPSEPVLAFSRTIFDGAIDVLDSAVRGIHVSIDVGFAREGRSTAWPLARDYFPSGAAATASASASCSVLRSFIAMKVRSATPVLICNLIHAC